jgi:uncharacterized protein
VRLSAIYAYPIKSCAPVSLAHAVVDRRGIEGDRRWMVVDGEGRFLNQRTLPQMARIHPTFDGPNLAVRSADVAIDPLLLREARGARRSVRIGKDDVDAIHDPKGSAWFSRVLGVDVSLVAFPEGVVRPARGEGTLPSDVVAFSDGYPFLLTAVASLDALAERVGAAVDMLRFRPNVVVTGSAPFAEDEWRGVEIGALRLRAGEWCERCSIVGVDPATGVRGAEPLRTLATFRCGEPPRGSAADAAGARKVFFGRYLVHDDVGTIRVGDPVHPIPSETS